MFIEQEVENGKRKIIILLTVGGSFKVPERRRVVQARQAPAVLSSPACLRGRTDNDIEQKHMKMTGNLTNKISLFGDQLSPK